MHKVRGPLSVWQIQMQAVQLMGEGCSGSEREEVGAEIAVELRESEHLLCHGRYIGVGRSKRCGWRWRGRSWKRGGSAATELQQRCNRAV
jgi:hypothetical protein